MENNVFVVSKGEGNTVTALEGGTYVAVCTGLIDLGLQEQEYQGEKKKSNKVMLQFTLPEEIVEINGENVPRQIHKEYTSSLADKAKLRADLESWRGKKFTEEELNGFDLMNILGAPALLSILAVEKNGRTYNNIATITKVPKGTGVECSVENFTFSAKDKNSWKAFSNLPEWIKDKINAQINIPADFVKHTEFEALPIVDDDEDGLPF